eukprot:TRINITY_DN5313_c0_g1_i1.p1 TRINITY_DN5313_c0_g1~~TRINITY_DN5313_c0_g1_i1.p1  ORF type:complete len:230 (-),score=70.31 TRINITY_DN5313_c0_g1_i1:190-879(-)
MTDVAETSTQTESAVVQEEAGPKTLQEALQINPFFHTASRVVSWKDPVESGLVFTIITAFFYLITCGGYTVVTLVSYLLLAFLLTAAAYVSGLQFYGSFRGQPIVENPLVKRLKNYNFTFTRRDLEPHLILLEILINDALAILHQAFSVTDVKYTLKVAGAFWVASFVGSWSPAALLYLVILAAFIWPRLYAEKKAEIDRAALLLRQKMNFYLKQAIAKLPPAIKAKLE